MATLKKKKNNTIDEFGVETGSIGERKENQRVAMNQGPSTPIKYDDNMGYMPDLGAGRLNDKKIRFKKKIPRA